MLSALLLSFAVIFIAELGDKTQLVAMMFALRYRWWVVLSAITVATALVHVLSVAIGHYLGAALPTHLLGMLAGAAFIFFGLWTLRGDSLSDEEESRARQATGAAFMVVTSAFVLAELGDKTMLATITLAADNGWLGIWIGSTLGMVAADGLAILVGAVAGKNLPEKFIQLSAAALFLLFGAYMLLENILPTVPAVVVAGMALAVVIGGAVALWALPERRRPAVLRAESTLEEAVPDKAVLDESVPEQHRAGGRRSGV
ncbi:TMEM165/GDT1 family protein [Mycobacterium sp. Y57]|uniref:TMEM165/GDT1 family protein n=1 Tax=Mycolicibacterium xanthum TaxID=2796469 RepID=UPI001C85D472|nr:TMEM165/GDT1 family protein [Mycolicibacterium xanthum]MBX7435108.1 TMEM165/GDT1 family protein [Mycolicibacterium xanthum]